MMTFTSENNEILPDDKYVVRKQITIGEWGIFNGFFLKNCSEDSGADGRLEVLIGMVLGFTYLDGKTFKAREFSKVSANVFTDQVSDLVSDTASNPRDVGILCAFFALSADGKLTSIYDDKHKFTNIKSYIGTIKPPVYINKLLTISEKLVEEIERYKLNHNNCQ